MTGPQVIPVDVDRLPGWSRGQGVAAATALALTVFVVTFLGVGKWLDLDGAGSAEAGMQVQALPEGVNEADVAFLRAMVPHLGGMHDAAEIAAGRAEDSGVRAFAEQLRNDMYELRAAKQLLGSIGVAAEGPSEHDSGVGTIDHSSLRQLADALPADVGQLFLQLLRRHHEGTELMVGVQLRGGAYGPARDLARQILARSSDRMGELDLVGVSAPQP